MKKARHFKASGMAFDAFGGPPGKASIARLIGPEDSATMGAGVAIFDGCSIEWTVLYDEVIVVLEGTFRLKLGKDFSETLEAAARRCHLAAGAHAFALRGRRRQGLLRALSSRLAQAPCSLSLTGTASRDCASARTRAFHARIPKSLKLWQKAKGVMPNGVPMSWMLGLHRHAPVFASQGEKAWFTDVDGNRYLDMNLSDLSATTGFGHPAITRAVARQAARGAQFLLPAEDSITVSELLKARTGMPFWQFTLCGLRCQCRGLPACPPRHGTPPHRDVRRASIMAISTKCW